MSYKSVSGSGVGVLMQAASHDTPQLEIYTMLQPEIKGFRVRVDVLMQATSHDAPRLES